MTDEARQDHWPGLYKGTVTVNKDPEFRGRLQLNIPAVLGYSPSTWAEPCAPLAGPTGPPMGAYLVPPPGAGVWVMFEQGNVNRPVWLGCRFETAADVPPLAQVGNPLYRTEIHRGGAASTATFKWSRDNGSIAARWLGSEGDVLIVSPGRGFRAGDWVELSHEELELAGQPGELVRLTKVEGDRLTTESPPAMLWDAELRGACVRRWDQHGHDDLVLRGCAAPVTESSAIEPQWIDIGDGLQSRFEPGGTYRTGDYWTIKASAATGSIEWPAEASGRPQALPPQGVQHYYAPLGILSIVDEQATVESCRRCLALQTVDCPPAPAPGEGDQPTRATRPSGRSERRRRPKR